MSAKRPALDVLPDHVEQRMPWDPYVEKGKTGPAAGVELILARIAGDPSQTVKKDAAQSSGGQYSAVHH
jgi:hypothetical protein